MGVAIMEWFELEWFSFVVVGLGTMFLLGEFLVRAKGIFFLLGLGLITTYFLQYLDPSMFVIMGIVYVGGIILIFVDGEYLNDGTLAAIGGVLMIVSVGMSSPNFTVGTYAVLGLLLGAVASLVWLKILPKRQLWDKIALNDRMTDDRGYSSINPTFKALIGKRGIAATDLRPVGRIEIDENEFSAITNGHYIEKGTPIVIKQVDGTRILVDEITEE